MSMAASTSLLSVSKFSFPSFPSSTGRPRPPAISSLCSIHSPASAPWRKSAAVRASAVAHKWEPSKVVPQADRVLIRLQELPEQSSGGVLLPKSAVKFERYLMGEILSVGLDVGDVEAGKKVLFSDLNAYEVDLGTEARHCFCRAADLLATVE